MASTSLLPPTNGFESTLSDCVSAAEADDRTTVTDTIKTSANSSASSDCSGNTSRTKHTNIASTETITSRPTSISGNSNVSSSNSSTSTVDTTSASTATSPQGSSSKFECGRGPVKPVDIHNPTPSSNGHMSNNSGGGDGTSRMELIKKKKFWGVLIGLIAVLTGIWWQRTLENAVHEEVKEELLANVGQNGLDLFNQYDFNEDGYLSLCEFVPVIERLLDVKIQHKHNFEFDPGDETLIIKASFQPLLLNSMTKVQQENIVETVYQVSRKSEVVMPFRYVDFTWNDPYDYTTNYPDQLTGLKEWKMPAVEMMEFGAKYFKTFLPHDSDYTQSVGTPYMLWETSRMQYITGQLPSNNRYHPPKFPDKNAIFHTLLSMLHPRPFLISRFEPQGAVACVRAYNDKYLDIAFRIHSEFQLNLPPYLPFWFTPAYFSGNLVISRNSSSIFHFHLAVPNQNKLNVDMEWLMDMNGKNNMEVDIGYMPQMELKSLEQSSIPPVRREGSIYDEVTVSDSEVPSIKWNEEISMEEAMGILEVKMLPFKEELKKDPQPEVAKLATLFLDSYEFPVMMIVALPNGTVVTKINANDLIDLNPGLLETGFHHPASISYLKFLEKGLQESTLYLTESNQHTATDSVPVEAVEESGHS